MLIPNVLISFFEGAEIVWLAFIICAACLLIFGSRKSLALRNTLLVTMLVILAIGIAIGFYHIYRDGYISGVRYWPFPRILL